MSNKTQLQENNTTLEYVIEQLQNMPSTEDCMERIEEVEAWTTANFAPTIVYGTKEVTDGDASPYPNGTLYVVIE